MELEEIYTKYPWLKEAYQVGRIYNPMVGAATGTYPEIDPMDYLEAVILLLVKVHGYELDAATYEVMNNLGYYAGYFGEEAMQKVEEVYGARHPIFG